MTIASPPPALLLAIAPAAALLCAALAVLLRPLLVRYALARPNARSSHKVPTPQGGGIAVIAATIAAVALAGLGGLHGALAAPGAVVLAAAVVLAVVGTVDDLRPIPVLPRLVLQAAAVAAVIAVLPGDARILPPCPLWLERAVLALGLLWFVNLTNFMDGLDWMTVAELVPVTAALAAFAAVGAAPGESLPVMLALAGALIGFAPFNRPVARLFLGDVGSLPLGLLTGWGLVLLAGNGHLAAALLLPLYYLVDATLTLGLRLRRGEKVWEAHRSHFYQRATDNGFAVIEVVGQVFVLNLVLAALAALSLAWPSALAGVALVSLGAAAVAVVMARFARPRNKT